MFLMKFVMQLINLCFGSFESFLANGGNFVNPSLTSSDIFEDRFQQAAALQTMQERVERAGANTIPVMPQLLHHG
jgi:hypothetical protein